MRFEGVLSGFNNKGRCASVELVDVGLEPAVLRLAEVEGERVERLADGVDCTRAFPGCGVPGDHHPDGNGATAGVRIVGLGARVDGASTRQPEVLHQEPEIEPGGAAADTDDSHSVPICALYRASIF